MTLFPFHVFKFEKIQQLTGTPHTPVPTPDFLFEIEYFDPANARFYETKGERDLIYAFHGSRLENFHSIIHNGLHCHLNKVSLGRLLRSTGGVCWVPAGALLVESTWGGRFTEATALRVTCRPAASSPDPLGLRPLLTSALTSSLGDSPHWLWLGKHQ